MTTAAFTEAKKEGRCYLYSWTLTTAVPIGDPISTPGASDRCFQVGAVTWGSATLVIEGSLDGGTTYTTLTDAQGNALSKTSGNPLLTILENPLLTRPQLSAVGSGASVVVYILARSTMP